MKLAVVTVLVFFLLLPAEGSPLRWVPSDSLGQLPSGVVSTTAAGRGWYLGVETEGTQERRTLVFDGEEQRTFLLDFDTGGNLQRRRVFQKGVLVQDVVYASGELEPLSETLFVEGTPRLVFEYRYTEAGLASRRVVNADGEFLYQDTLFRYPDGRLRRLERDGPAGALAEISWSYSAAGLAQVWVADEDLKAEGHHKVLTYTEGEVREDLLRETELLFSRISRDLEGGFSLEREGKTSGETVDRTKDDRGRLVTQTTTFADGAVQTTRWTWDEKDRVLGEETSIRGGLEVTSYTYSEDGVSVAEKRRFDRLSRRETRQDGEKTLVELFDDGIKFLEEVWDNGRKVAERYFDGEVLVRERRL